MFYIIGIGLVPEQLTLEAKNAIKDCKEVYIDNYTNIFSKGELLSLEKIITKKIITLNRTELEQEKKFLKKDSCLLVIGNVLSATTHYSLYQEAKSKNIKIKVIPGISIFNYRAHSGLYEYKFGKTVSIVYPEKNYFPTSFYDVILDNLKIKAHTFCLLDIKVLENRFMSVYEACEILEKIDEKKILENLNCLALVRMGCDEQKIIGFTFKDYKKLKIKEFPQTMIVCGELNDFERVAIDEHRIN
ncbi:MAG: diphthine synthase [archaeon]|jgi:diphthine synthase|nr:diphthine synthase [archaeon]MDD2477817.1 diphthine synthase [Candidatus ainarchaeum sp.]MDD3084671.1 diphthine synthase [Candidatus ainarchaeum sp.]MDD4221217.1 diphthine synthase [Candidatus ainarchaeum sp.]MDD4662724.1 diphthine synthase [Candidatus ainarchaeum sp.]